MAARTPRPRKSPRSGVAKHEIRPHGKSPSVLPPRVSEPVAEELAESAAALAFPVVGVGASAGGLEAFSRLLRALPADSGAAFVLVQHLSPSRESELASILSRATSMPVSEVVDESAIQPNHVYVLPPGKAMVMVNGHLRLLSRGSRGAQHPIDQFFRSLAEQQRHLAIGVVLSGTATDGTLGLEEIKAEGGITFAQDDTAQQPGMPHSAIASGCVDFVLSPEGIAGEIPRIVAHPLAGLGVAPRAVAARKGELQPVLSQLRRATGVDFTEYKSNTLSRRIRRRMVLAKQKDLAHYERFLRDTPKEMEALYEDILINVTGFFRDPDMFEALKKTVLPPLLENRSREDRFRVWVLGCATGEEAYSLAMIISEVMDSDVGQPPAQIFATDLNQTGIDHARAGIYSEARLQHVSPERLRRFFVKHGGTFQVQKSLRDMCVFSRHNVMADPPFSRMDLISCRNLLIYLEPSLQQRVLPLLHYALKPEGRLVLGASETVGPLRDLFGEVDKRHKLYSRKPATRTLHRLPTFPLQEARKTPRSDASDHDEGAGHGTGAAPLPAAAAVQKEADRLLASFAPPAVLIDPNLEILEFHGNTKPYLTPAEGKASFSLLKMARPELAAPLRSLLHRAKKSRRAVREDGISLQSKGARHEITLEILPVKGGSREDISFLVVFRPAAANAESVDKRIRKPTARARGGSEESEALVARIEREFASSREHLRALIEQHDTSNEELQAANEEAQSANEELQSINEELATSKEEIQSSNEELTTVNDELHNRNDELGRANSDLANTIHGVHIAIVIVGRDLTLRRFSPMAEELLGIVPADIGRPITNIKMKLGPLDLGQLLNDAIDTLLPSEREVQIDGGRWYGLRIRPYITLEGRVDGAIFSLVDIDDGRRARLETEHLNATLRQNEARLERDLTAAEHLQEVSSRLIAEGDVEQFYGELLDVAIVIMEADMGSIQLVDKRERALRLLSWRGFDEPLAKAFQSNRSDTRSSCSIAWQLGHRVVVPDVETCAFLAGTTELEDHRKTGIQAVQSTPLVSRGGEVLGMISTHWRARHEPTEHALRHLDVLARLAADLLDRRRLEDDLRKRSEELAEADNSKT
jgi:two-component system CheB/CheR fusion protein